MLRVVPTAAPVGAEIRGIDISDLDSKNAVAYEQIISSLHEHSVIFFREQKLQPVQLARFSRRLGVPIVTGQPELNLPGFPEISRLSNIFENRKPIGLFEAGQYWHTDRSFHAIPQGYAVLHAIEIPTDAAGTPLGDTLFVSTAYAYETLPADVKRQVCALRAIHSFRNPYKKQYSQARDAAIRLEEFSLADQSHPVVRMHPVTGRPCIYVNQQYTSAIEGMEEAEGRKLIDYLCTHITREEVRYRHRWAEGDLLIWDDCATQHHAVGDYKPPSRRLILRIATKGTKPVAAH